MRKVGGINKRKLEQAKRTKSKGRKRIMREMKGGRTVVTSKENIALLSLFKPQIPIAVKRQMQKNIDAVLEQARARAAAPVEPAAAEPDQGAA